MALPPFLAFLDQTDPEFAQAIEKIASTAMKPGALDAKTKLLIAMALDAAHGAATGVESIARTLRGMGTTDAEIAEALRIAYYAFGNGILAASAAASSRNKPE
ncbi:carboxymuconolactone decarboxylase family protein [Peptococcaceae bacterium CEB3]|nr:carboxymuconolactone decarboxylase family protein [Peptococcaceae bacterium CEB3]